MATADELLAGMLDTVPEHTHPVVDSNTYFVIDPTTRKISNGSRTANVLMQNDHDSERYTFEVPRYIEGHDMMLCNRVKVHYNNIESETGTENADTYEVDDLRLNPDDEDKVICSWLISRNATQLVGNLSFIVQYSCATETGDVVYKWHTDIFSDVEVRESRNNGEASVIEYSDILEQWYAKLFGAEESAVAGIQATFTEKKTELLELADEKLAAIQTASETNQTEIESLGARTRASIPADYTTTHNMADEALRKKANAIILNESGNSIFLDDSSDCNLIGLNMCGKTTQDKTNGYQLFDASRLSSLSKGAVIVTNNDDGSFTVGGSGNDTESVVTSYYYTHEEFVRMFKAGPVNLVSTRTRPYFSVTFRSTTGSQSEVNLMHTSPTATVTQDMLDDESIIVRFSFTMDANQEIIPGVVKPMLYQDGDGTWEPFTGGNPSPNPDYPQELESVENTTVKLYGKNLLRNQYNDVLTTYGITFTKLPDGGIHITGTPNRVIYYNIDFLTDKIPILNKKDSVTASLYMTNMDSEIRMLVGYFREDLTHVNTVGNASIGVTPAGEYIPEYTFTYPDEAVYHRTYLSIIDTTNVIDTVIYPMIRLTQADSSFDKFNESTLTISRAIRGIPVSQNGNYTDDNGQQWICDEIDFERGKFIQRINCQTLAPAESCFIGSDKFVYHRAEYNAVYSLPILSTHYQGLMCNASGASIKFPGFDTVEEWKTYITSNTIQVCYVMQTPIEHDLTATETEAFRALHTNATNTTILNDSSTKMGIKYVADLERYIYKNITIKHQKLDIVLPASKWVAQESGAYYSQVVDVSVRKNSKIELNPTAEQQVNLILYGLAMFVTNENGVVTAYSVGGAPTADMTIPAMEQVVFYA